MIGASAEHLETGVLPEFIRWTANVHRGNFEGGDLTAQLELKCQAVWPNHLDLHSKCIDGSAKRCGVADQGQGFDRLSWNGLGVIQLFSLPPFVLS